MKTIVYIGLPSEGHFVPSETIMRELLKKKVKLLYLGCEHYKKRIEEMEIDYIYCSEIERLWNENKLMKNSLVYVPKKQFTIEKIKKNYLRWINDYKNKGNIFLSIVEKLHPDYIIYDAHARWGRFVASNLGLPALSIQTSVAANAKMCTDNFDFFARYFLKAEKHLLKESFSLKLHLENYLKKICLINHIQDFSLVDGYGCQSHRNILWGRKELQPFSEYFTGEKYFFYSCYKRDFDNENLLSCRSVIYICLGSVLCNCGDSWKFYNDCISALKGLKNYTIVISAGENVDKVMKDKRVIVKKNIDQQRLLKRVALCINHGGKNTIEECIDNEVPMLVYPYSNDQFINAFMVEKRGFGRKLNNIEEKEIRRLANEILTEYSYKKRIHLYNLRKNKKYMLSNYLNSFLN